MSNQINIETVESRPELPDVKLVNQMTVFETLLNKYMESAAYGKNIEEDDMLILIAAWKGLADTLWQFVCDCEDAKPQEELA